MGKKRVFTKIQPKGEKMPAIRIQFTGAEQYGYLALLRKAREEGTNQTALCRRILLDWVKMDGARRAAKRPDAKQVSISLKAPRGAKKKEVKQ